MIIVIIIHETNFTRNNEIQCIKQNSQEVQTLNTLNRNIKEIFMKKGNCVSCSCIIN